MDRRREFEQICVAMIITQNVTDRQGDLTTMMMNNLAAVTNVLCPADCSNNGRCVDGTCQCSTGMYYNTKTNDGHIYVYR